VQGVNVKNGEKRSTAIQCAIAVILAWSLCVNAAAQNGDALNVDLAKCVDLDTEQARFECYQERVDAALEHRDVPAQNSSVEPATAAAASAAAAAPAAAARPDAVIEQTDASGGTETEEIFATITALQERIPNTWVITLDNGQIWAMNQPRRYPLRVGLDVKLYPTKWGTSYRLTSPEHGSFVQVERVR
jgi:hypothetical protein